MEMTPGASLQADVSGSPLGSDQNPEPLQSADVSVGRDRRHGLLDRVGFGLFLGAVVLAPIPDGSVGFVWIQVWVVTLGLATCLISYRGLSFGGALVIWAVVIILFVYLLVAWLQSVSPGPSPLPVWSETAKLLGTDLAPLSSSVRNTPFPFLGRPLLAALLLAVGIALGTDRARASLVLRAIVSAACLFGAIGFFGFVFNVRDLRPFDQAGALTTFFLNKNTSATYLGSAFLVVFCLLLPPAIAIVRQRRSLTVLFQGASRRRRIVEVGAALFLLILLPLTLSRAGVMLTVFVALSMLALKLELKRWGGVWRLCLVLLVIFAFIFALSGESWHERNARLGFDTLGRLDAYQEMLGAARDHPWLGLGLGSFTQSFPQFRTEDLGLYGTFNIGHSTPIELVFEGGYPLAVCVFAFVAGCVAVLVRGALRRPDDPYIMAAISVGVLGLLHTSFDFPLQIPGYLINYLAVVGIGIGRSFLPREEREFSQRRVVRSRSGISRSETSLPKSAS